MIAELFEKNNEVLLKDRYCFNLNKMKGGLRKVLKFADGKLINKYFDEAVLVLLGPETEEDK